MHYGKKGFLSFNHYTEDLSSIACAKPRKVLTAYCSSDKCCVSDREVFDKELDKMVTKQHRRNSVIKDVSGHKTHCPDCRSALHWEQRLVK
jgi:hypothetical protein